MKPVRFAQGCLASSRLIKAVTLTLVVLVTFGILSSLLLPFHSHAEVARRTYTATADTYLKRNDPSEPYGSFGHIDMVNNTDIISLLRFDVTGVEGQTVTRAILRLSVMNGAARANVNVFATNNDWDERTVSWKKRPQNGVQLTELPATRLNKGDWIELDLRQAIAGNGAYSFALTTTSRDRIAFRSRSTKFAPQLVLQLQSNDAGVPAPPPTPTLPPAPAPSPAPQTSNEPAIFAPQQLAMDAPEIVNPMRGLYRWMGQEFAPQPIPARDSYDRYTWRDLEPTQGDYRFAALDADIAQAAREGRKFSFRVRTVVSTKGASIPDYAMGSTGWWADYDNNGDNDTYVPDWNDSTFLNRLGTFMQALGKRYDGDPRIAFVDIGLYGNWGEWHMSGFNYPSASGAQRAATATKYRLVDMHIAAFPSTPLVMMTDDTEALVYAMSRSSRIGWRRDSLGWDTGHFGKIERDPAIWNALKDRWKTAPVVSEFCNPRFQKDPQVFQQALTEVQRYHISLVSNANTIKWSDLSPNGKDAFTILGKTTGYRLTLNELSLPAYLSAGDSFNIQTRWSNVGVAPVYEPWQIHVQLRKAGSNEVVWETVSTLDLSQVLPGAPTNQTDAVVLPKNMAKGQYDVFVVVQDQRQTRAPLALALVGVQADGSYHLGTVSVQ